MREAANRAGALVAGVGDFGRFDITAQVGSWLGMARSQDSSGGKMRPGRISQRGDTYM